MQRDFGEQIAQTLVQLAAVLEGLEPDEWGAATLCERWTVRDAAGHIVWRLGSSYSEMVRTALPLLTLSGPSPSALTEAVSRQEGEASSPEELVRRLRHIAALRLAGIGRTGLNDLVEAVVHSYDIVQPLGVPIDVDPEATRLIALRGMLLGSGVRRAVAGRHTLYAADAGWAVGRGPIIEGTARGIVLFLFGRDPLPARAGI
ncbi:maleylpyruvate isomerase family mycothiol-dependent enzyme [Planctomonas sp. JC2975]|uniref:maleylpyruvate isomerase family mycothiol-dependent enzyme n=1 Tax=Planctomonas sp. JC2975 TaxID=2729626 RepID=UPI001475BC59|nr:maleylpyruvate isomerase family mycothiol-dependent enzyme [Planctomonas sp. JC2975]NNC13280.1 maleylpyruvate isomerase family mycothiol-dependent enzyme [Planctomonas sp. JC2975]